MNEKQIKALLKKLISNQVSKKTILLVLTCANDYEEDVKDLLVKFQPKCNYYFIFSNSFKSNMNMESWKSIGNEISSFVSFREIIDQIDLVMLPFLTRNSLAKLALGIADTFSLVATQHCILTDKKIIAIENSWDVTNETGKIKGLNKNPAYTLMLNKYREQLIEFGVISVPLSEAKQQVEKQLFQQFNESEIKKSSTRMHQSLEDRSILTLEDVKDNPNIRMNTEIKMTDLAREYLTKKQRKETN